VAADRFGDVGCRGAPADHPPGIGLGHWIVRKHFAVVIPCRPEQPTFPVVGNAGRVP
jgi:hypothetical protein